MKLEFFIATLMLAMPNILAQNEPVEPLLEYDQEAVGRDLKMHSSVFFVETFNDKEAFKKSWTVSAAKKKIDDGSVSQYDGDWIIEKPVKDSLPNDLGLTYALKAKHRAVSSKLSRDFIFSRRPFVIQYEVIHQEGQECGGAYLKLISKERPIADLNEFNDKTPYSIMFGPDKCGTVNKLHFIFRHKNPLNGSFEEKHCKPAQTRIDEVFTDSKPHLFKLVLTPDSNFSIYVDNKLLNEGSMLENFEPPVNPPQFIDDPNDKKPSDWDDREKIPDPAAKKPEDWDETALPEIPDVNAVKPEGWLEEEPINISDPSAEKPDDWDDEMDGEWEAPLVPNPACEDAPGCGPWTPPLINNPNYKGKWSPPLISNPNFKGIWKPRKIPNPDFFEDRNPFHTLSPIDAVGFELWSVSSKIMFDNIIITDDDNVAKQFAALTFDKKIITIEKSADTLLNQFVAFTNRYPWLWAVYIVVLLIPITLIVVCCFWNTKDSDAERKKNDDLPPDSPSGGGVIEENSFHSPTESSLNQASGSTNRTRNDEEDGRSSSVTDTDTGSVACAHDEYQAEMMQDAQRNSEERSVRQGSEDRAVRQGSEERSIRGSSEERSVRGGSETREVPSNALHAHSEEQNEAAPDAAEDSENASEHSGDDKHQSSAEPEMILKRRK